MSERVRERDRETERERGVGGGGKQCSGRGGGQNQSNRHPQASTYIDHTIILLLQYSSLPLLGGGGPPFCLP